MFRQFRPRHRPLLTRQFVIAVTDQFEPVLEQWHVVEILARAPATGDAEIDFIAQQPLLNLARVSVRHVNRDARVLNGKRLDDGRQDAGCDRWQCGDAYMTAAAFCRRIQIENSGIEIPDQPLGDRHESVALDGRRDPSRRPLEQFQTDIIFELLDSQCNRRLRPR